MVAEIIQIYYDDAQLTSLYPFAKPYKNENLTIFFENSVLKDVVLASESEKIAVCSWKLKEKLRWYIGKHRELTQEVLESDYYVLSMTRNSPAHQMLAAANKYHKGFKEGMQILCDHIGLKVPGEVKQPIYQNHFSAKREIYLDYVQNYLSPGMDFMATSMKELALMDSNYSQLSRSKITPDYLMDKIGLPYFPLAPFILERLFSVYIQNKKIKVTWL